METETRLALTAWLRYLGAGLAAYLAACAACAWALSHVAPGAGRTVLILLPVLPGLYLIWTTARLYRRCDEYVRLRILQSVAWAAAVTAAWTLAYAFLELAGLPRLGAAWVSNVGWAVFVGAMLRFIASHR